MNKGKFGYLAKEKKKQLIKLLVLIAVALAIFTLGYFLNKRETANVFTILAILFVLPGARTLVNLIVLLPYRSITRTEYDEVMKYTEGTDIVFTDLVITSEQKVMNLHFLIVRNNQVLGLLGRAGQDVKYIREYLLKGLKSRALLYQVKVVEDKGAFIKQLSKIPNMEVRTTEQEELVSYLRSLIV